MTAAGVRFLFLALLTTSTVLLVRAQEEEPLVDDVDRTDFSDPALNSDLDKVRLPTGPHSEVESASMLVDLTDDKVPVGMTSFMLVSLTNLGSKMFNVSAITGSLSSTDGKELQKFPRQEYGDPLGPREQRSFLFGFEPNEETPPAQYMLEFKIFYNNRDKDQFVDTVYRETNDLVPKPPSMDMKMWIALACGVVCLLLCLVLLSRCSSRSGKSKTEKPSKANAKASTPAVAKDEWLASTLAGSEDQALKKRKKTKKH